MQSYGVATSQVGVRAAGIDSVPSESFAQVLDSTAIRLGEVEAQVNEVMERLFNPPVNASGGAEKQLGMTSASEKALDLRSRVTRINASLASILEKL